MPDHGLPGFDLDRLATVPAAGLPWPEEDAPGSNRSDVEAEGVVMMRPRRDGILPMFMQRRNSDEYVAPTYSERDERVIASICERLHDGRPGRSALRVSGLVETAALRSGCAPSMRNGGRTSSRSPRTLCTPRRPLSRR